MYISPVNFYNYSNTKQNVKKSNKITFNAHVAQQLQGKLKPLTSNKINELTHALLDIIEKLACISDEGIKFITENFPVSIRDCIIFHNCGENNSSIALSRGNNETQNLIHLTRRKGDSFDSRRIVNEAFMIEGNQKLLSNFKDNYMRAFPKERKYLSQDEIDQKHLDENLQKLLDELEPIMFKFRVFLLKNSDRFAKIPDGKISFDLISNIKLTEKYLNEARDFSKKIPPKQLYKLLEENFKEYIPLKGNSNYSFKNLGEENLTISYANVDSKYHKNLKRLTVYNQDNSVKQVFLLQDNKLVKNTSLDPNYLADNFEFYDAKEIETVSEELSKYLKLYQSAAMKLQAIVQQRAKEIAAKEVVGILPENVKESFQLALEKLNEILNIYKKAYSVDKKEIRETLSLYGIKLTPSGITMPAKEKFKEIYLQPVKSDIHSNLVKFFITDYGTEMMEYYLIHENDKIVKNFWANSPNIIPQKLKYVEESQIPDLTKISKDTCDLLDEIKTKIEECLTLQYEKRSSFSLKKAQERQMALEEAKARKAKLDKQKAMLRETDQKIRTEKKTERQKKRDEQKALSKKCKQMLASAMKNLNEGIESFNLTMQEIQKMVTDFYNESKK